MDFSLHLREDVMGSYTNLFLLVGGVRRVFFIIGIVAEPPSQARAREKATVAERKAAVIAWFNLMMVLGCVLVGGRGHRDEQDTIKISLLGLELQGWMSCSLELSLEAGTSTRAGSNPRRVSGSTQAELGGAMQFQRSPCTWLGVALRPYIVGY
eukprot:scaffold33592_cov115-Skeletonema_dohrnii-CCMP3373.AAC.4